MLRSLALALLLCVVASEARCKGRYREFKSPTEELRRPRGCRGAGSFIGEDYWTTVGYDGIIRDGRSTADFLQIQQGPQTTGYIAYWITRTKYGNVHYEAFGHATIRPDRRVCAWFVGLNKEIVEVCGGFRVLSRNRFRQNEENPFEWVQGGHLDAKSTLGFHEHRIAKYAWQQDEVFYGDARLQDRNFQGVSPNSERFLEVTSPSEFDQKVWLLRRRPDMQQPSDLRSSAYGAYEPSYPAYDQRYPQDTRTQYPSEQRTDPRMADPEFRRRVEEYHREQQLIRDQQQQNQQQPRFVNITVDTGRQEQDRTVDLSAQERRAPIPSTVHRIGTGAYPSNAKPSTDDSSRFGLWPVTDRENVDEYGRPISSGARPAESISGGAQQDGSRIRYAKVRPPTIVRDQYGNTYERRIENGQTIFYADPHVHGKRIETVVNTQPQQTRDDDFQRYQQQMRDAQEERRRQEETIRQGWLVDRAANDRTDASIVQPAAAEEGVESPVRDEDKRADEEETNAASNRVEISKEKIDPSIAKEEEQNPDKKKVIAMLPVDSDVEAEQLPVAVENDDEIAHVPEAQLPAAAPLHVDEEREDSDDWRII